MIRMVIFDMAGTTVDENNIVYKTLQKTINKSGFDFSLEQVLAVGAGKEKLTAIKDIIQSQNGDVCSEQMADKIYSAFIGELTDAYNRHQLKPQPGAEALFKALKEKQITVILNTGYNKTTAHTILQKLGWHTGVQIDALITADDVTSSRPSPDMIFLAMQQFGIDDAGEVIKVGDSIIDIEEGKNAGCYLSIGITTGAHTHEQLAAANPDKIIAQLADLLPII
jgi:phosphonatase-like hydrolase